MDTTGTIVSIEYKTDKYNQETRTTDPCKPHYVFKCRLPAGHPSGKAFAYVRKYDTPAAAQYLAKFKVDSGLGPAMDTLNKPIGLYLKESNNPQYGPSWEISTRQAPPAPVQQAASAADYVAQNPPPAPPAQAPAPSAFPGVNQSVPVNTFGDDDIPF